jgi:hypothetical protein
MVRGMSATTDPVVAARLARQLLGGDHGDRVREVVERVVGVQAQAVAPARLAFRPRTKGVTAGDVDDATRTAQVVRTWLMRGTLHLIDVADLDWLLTVYGELNIRADARRRGQLGLTESVLAAARAALPEVLDEPLPRPELIARLREAGVRVGATGQAPAHLMMYAASTGLICRGPELDRDKPSYVLTDQWLGRSVDLDVDRGAALATLARRYLAGYGPASLDDFAHWSGLPKKEVRAALNSLEKRGEVVTVAGDVNLLTLDPDHDPVPDPVLGAGPARASGVRLLGAFDALLLGYRSRAALVDDEHAAKIRAGGGMIAATALDDGRIVGTWSVDRSRKDSTVLLEPFTSIPRSRVAAWQEEVADLARFLDEPLTLTLPS